MAEEIKEVKGAQLDAPKSSPQGGEDPKEAADKADTEAKAAKKDNKPKGYIVISPFSDINNFKKTWNKGDDVSHFDADRLAMCIDRGLVKES